jgi:TonB family protein
MFCQTCGTENPEDARYCKYCGTAIAAPGDRGGLIIDKTNKAMDTLPAVMDVETTTPAPPPVVEPDEKGRAARAKPPAAAGDAAVQSTLAGLRKLSTNSLTSMSLSLATVSVRSPWRVWAIIAVAGLLLLAVGAGVMYAAMGALWQPQAVIASTPPSPSEPLPIVLGGGDDGQFISSGPVVAELGSGKVTGNGAKSSSSSSSSNTGKRPATEKTTAQGGGATSQAKSSTPDPQPSGKASSTTTTAPDETGEEPGGAGEPASGTGAGSSGTATMPPGFDDEGEERDIEMDMYAGQVRRVIAQYYAARAQSCFDRATRNNNTLRGTVVIRFTVGGDGTVTRASPQRNTTGDDDLGACLAAQVQSWRLPAPPSDQPVTLEMPFSW